MTNPYPIPRAVRQTDILVGNGGATYGPFDGFKCFDVQDIVVYVRNQNQVDFAKAAVVVAKVSGLPFDLFTVTFPADLPATSEYVVSSERVAERSAGVEKGTLLDMSALEKELSKVATVQQEVRRDVDRALKFQFGAQPQDFPVPEPGKALGWSSGGRLANLRAFEAGTIPFGNTGEQLAATSTAEDANQVIGTDTRETRLHGAGSKLRTQPARFGDTIDLREFFDRSGAVGTEEANNAAFTALLAELAANPMKKTLKGHMGDVYRISGETARTFPGVGNLQMDGAAFHWTGNLGGSAASLLNFEDGWDVSGMEVVVLNGASFRRLVRFLGGAIGHRISDNIVWAESQINNQNGLLDYAVQFQRSNQRVRGFKVENIDKAILAYGADGDGNPGIGNRFEDIDVTNYVTGFELRNLLDCRNVGYRCKGRSPNATQDPGHNGLLHSGVADYVLLAYKIRDAAEHGCRFGGTRNAEQLPRGITMGPGEIIRSGQCGLKFFTGMAGQRFIDVNVSGVNVIDCQYEPENPGDLPGFNDEGFLLQQIVNGTFTGLSVSRRDNPTGFSSDCCVFISGANHLIIEGLRGSKPRRNLIRISQWDDGAGTAPVETLDNTAIMIKGATGMDIGEDGLYIDSVTQSLRYINIDADMVGTNGAGFYGVRVNAAAARFLQPCVLQYRVNNFQAGAINAPTSSNPNLVTRNMFGSTF